MKIHTTKDGTKIKLRDMTDSHLAATIRMLERKASEGITIRLDGWSCPDDSWYVEYRLTGKAALERMGYAAYVKERDRRSSNSPDALELVAQIQKLTKQLKETLS